MSAAFDQLAPAYDALWGESGKGRAQRQAVWRVTDPLFQPGRHILDLGCGTGVDAEHHKLRGVRVTAIDASVEMVRIARSRSVHTLPLRIEELARLDGEYDGALSNFGALNCVRELDPVARELARLVRPGGSMALCVMGRFAPLETLRFLLRGQPRKAARRWSGTARWRGIDVRYWSRRELVESFGDAFKFERRVSVGWGDHQLYIFKRRRAC
jgi:SAM-dependent methyltransferase